MTKYGRAFGEIAWWLAVVRCAAWVIGGMILMNLSVTPGYLFYWIIYVGAAVCLIAYLAMLAFSYQPNDTREKKRKREVVGLILYPLICVSVCAIASTVAVQGGYLLPDGLDKAVPVAVSGAILHVVMMSLAISANRKDA